MILDKNNIDKHGVKLASNLSNFKARILAAAGLTADRVLTLPDSSGQLATEEYVAANSGGAPAYVRKTLTGDVTSVVDTNVLITEWAVDDLPYGLYAWQAEYRIENNSAGSAQVYIRVDDTSSGSSLIQASGLCYFSTANTIVSGEADLSSASGLVDNGNNELGLSINGASLSTGRFAYERVLDGTFWHANVNDGYYGNDFRISLRSVTNVVKLKAGSYIEYVLIEAF